MSSPASFVGRAFIISFVLWHAAAVAVYSVPDNAEDAISRAIRTHALPVFRPYVLLTSQWQKWNLYAPDPLRRVSTFHVQQLEGTMWRTIDSIGPGTYARRKNAPHFKVLLQADTYGGRMLQLFCAAHDLPDQSLLRLTEAYYVIPQRGIGPADPILTERTLALYACSPASS